MIWSGFLRHTKSKMNSYLRKIDHENKWKKILRSCAVLELWKYDLGSLVGCCKLLIGNWDARITRGPLFNESNKRKYKKASVCSLVPFDILMWAKENLLEVICNSGHICQFNLCGKEGLSTVILQKWKSFIPAYRWKSLKMKEPINERAYKWNSL